MKTMLIAAAALMLLAACDMPKAGCADCEKMAREANAKHDTMKHGKGCDCCGK